MMLSLDTAYRSFGGEVEASSTPTICRLSDSRRHQISAIAPRADFEGMPGSTSALIAERADARFAPSVAVACDHTTAIKQSCDLSVGYDTRQLADPRAE